MVWFAFTCTRAIIVLGETKRVRTGHRSSAACTSHCFRKNACSTNRASRDTRRSDNYQSCGKGSSFPEPGELVVTADDLSVEEKAKILYRHAKAGNLNTLFRSMIRIYATNIVVDDHFTPERIRRFGNERIPEPHVGDPVKEVYSRRVKG